MSSKFRGYGWRKKKINKNRKILSKSNVYGNKSSKAQARQIYALKKRVNYVYSLSKPDVQHSCCWARKVMTSEGLGISTEYLGCLVSPGSTTFVNNNGPITGTQLPNMNGMTMKIFGGSLKVSCSYSNNYWNQNDQGEANRWGCVRLLIVQRKASFNVNPANATPDYYIDDYELTGSGYNINHIKPLRTGILTECKILYDKYKSLTQTNNKCEFKFKIPRFDLEKMENNTYPKNVIQAYIISDGLTGAGSQHTSYVAAIEVTAQLKIDYSQDNE